MIQGLANALVLGSIYALFAFGLSLVWGTVDVLNFAHGSIFMFAAFLGSLILGPLRLPFWIVILLGVAVGAVISMLLQLVIFDPILTRTSDTRAAELQVLLAGIGISSMLVAIGQKYTDAYPFNLSGSSFTVKSYSVTSSLKIANIQIIILAVCLVATVLLAVTLRRSKFGLALRTVGVDADTAALVGIDRRRMAMLIMAISGGLAGLAGVLITFYLGSIDASVGDLFLVKAFACIVVGGVGSIAGTVVGTMALGLAETEILLHTSGTWVDAISFGLLFAFLVFRPQGLFGKKAVSRV